MYLFAHPSTIPLLALDFSIVIVATDAHCQRWKKKPKARKQVWEADRIPAICNWRIVASLYGCLSTYTTSVSDAYYYFMLLPVASCQQARSRPEGR